MKREFLIITEIVMGDGNNAASLITTFPSVFDIGLHNTAVALFWAPTRVTIKKTNMNACMNWWMHPTHLQECFTYKIMKYIWGTTICDLFLTHWTSGLSLLFFVQSSNAFSGSSQFSFLCCKNSLPIFDFDFF